MPPYKKHVENLLWIIAQYGDGTWSSNKVEQASKMTVNTNALIIAIGMGKIDNFSYQ